MCIDKVFKIYVMDSFTDARRRSRHRPKRTEYSRYDGEGPSPKGPPPRHQYQSVNYPYPSQNRQHVTLERREGVPMLDDRHTVVVGQSAGSTLHDVPTLRGGDTSSRSRHTETQEFGFPPRIDSANHQFEEKSFPISYSRYHKGPNGTQVQAASFEARGVVACSKVDDTIHPADRERFQRPGQTMSYQVGRLEEDRFAKSNSINGPRRCSKREYFRDLEVLEVAPNLWNDYSHNEYRAQDERPLEPNPFGADLPGARELSPDIEIPRTNSNLCSSNTNFERHTEEDRFQASQDLANSKNQQHAMWQDNKHEYRQPVNKEVRPRSSDPIPHTSSSKVLNLAAQRAWLNEQLQRIHIQAHAQARSHLRPLFAMRNFLSWNPFNPFQNNLDMFHTAEILSQATAFYHYQGPPPQTQPINNAPAIASPSIHAEYARLVEELAMNRSMQQEDAYIISDAVFHPHETRLNATHELAQLQAQEQRLVGLLSELELQMQAKLAVPFIDVTIYHQGLASEESESTIQDEGRIVELDIEELSLEGECDDEEETEQEELGKVSDEGGHWEGDTERVVGTVYEIDDDGEEVLEKKAKTQLLEDKKRRKGKASVRVL